MKIALLLVFIAATLVQVWARQTHQMRAALILKAKTMLDSVQRFVRDRLFRRRLSYRAIFLSDRGELSPAGRVVLAHLTQFCYAFTTTAAGETDDAARERREGRRQVWIEIMNQLNLDPQDALRAVQDERDPLAA